MASTTVDDLRRWTEELVELETKMKCLLADLALLEEEMNELTPRMQVLKRRLNKNSGISTAQTITGSRMLSTFNYDNF